MILTCIFLFHLAIPPPIALDGNSMVNVGRGLRLTCRSLGDFSGTVIWMKAEENVPSIGVYSYYYSLYQNYITSLFLSILSLIYSDTINNKTITTEDLEMLYVLQESENEAVLTTIEGFGITRSSTGSYICLATNNLTQAGMTLTVDVLGDSLEFAMN